MIQFFEFLISNFWASLVGVIGIISGIMTILSFISVLKEQTQGVTKRRFVMSAISILLVIISSAYLWEQYTKQKEQNPDMLSDIVDEKKQIIDAEQKDSIVEVTNNGPGVAFSGDGNTVNINNSENQIVQNDVISKIVLNQTELDMVVGESFQLSAQVMYSDNSQNYTLQWISSSPQVAEVDDRGRITALDSGKADIIVRSYSEGRTLEAQCNVKICKVPTGYKISLSTDNVVLGEEFDINIEPYDDDFEQIRVYSKAPSGHVYDKVFNGEPYLIYAETGIWTIYASIKNKAGEYEAQKAEDYVYIEVTNPLELLEPLFTIP